ncbi:MAG TPA: 4'-phosphopantetheinyl transferase superfamily protein, partial [Candidatus Acidoferrum sp.]|nr:4'-phosphopantetheinyl transferase superfamily protein [Candidatus Acidoferrum sp.]
GGEVHVWFARLDRTPARLARMRTVLNPDEAARADRFYLDVHRNRFIAARALLRDLLAGYLAEPPAAIRFEYNEWGKPALAAGFGASDLHFNLSHSQDLAMYAFVLERQVGVDLELIRGDFAGERIAENFFSTAEVQALRGLPLEHQAQAFFNCWTRKEAYVKARGQGLSIDLKSFDVSLIPGAEAKILRGDDCGSWSLCSFEPAAGWVAALAMQGTPLQIAGPRWL